MYKTAAERLGQLIGEGGHTLIYGAGNLGLMGVLGEAVHRHGGRVVGVIPEKLNDLDLAYTAADELVVTPDMRSRKAAMESRADAFIALPGGYGTLEEVVEVLVLKQLWYHEKPVVLLNTAGFYTPLVAFFRHQVEEHFIKAGHLDLFHLSPSPEDALGFVEAYEPVEPHGKWF